MFLTFAFSSFSIPPSIKSFLNLKMSANNSGSRGRTVGQVVAPYRTRRLDGDVVELARIISSDKLEIWK